MSRIIAVSAAIGVLALTASVVSAKPNANGARLISTKGPNAAVTKQIKADIKDEFDLDLIEAEHECDRISARRWECDSVFDAKVNFELFFEDIYGDEVYAHKGDTIECEVSSTVTRRGLSTLSRRYRVLIDEDSYECELLDEDAELVTD